MFGVSLSISYLLPVIIKWSGLLNELQGIWHLTLQETNYAHFPESAIGLGNSGEAIVILIIDMRLNDGIRQGWMPHALRLNLRSLGRRSFHRKPAAIFEILSERFVYSPYLLMIFYSIFSGTEHLAPLSATFFVDSGMFRL